jgi:hypothetical protein
MSVTTHAISVPLRPKKRAKDADRKRLTGSVPLFLMAFVASASLVQASSVSLQSSTTLSKFGSSVALTAAVTPASATGTVTFFDGTNILGYRSLSGGTAAVHSLLLSSGKHSLTAYYSGDSSGDAPATSTAVSETVNPTAATSFWNNTTVAVSNGPIAVATGDFNGDGIADLAVLQNPPYSYSNGSITIAIGNGKGASHQIAVPALCLLVPLWVCRRRDLSLAISMAMATRI